MIMIISHDGMDLDVDLYRAADEIPTRCCPLVGVDTRPPDPSHGDGDSPRPAVLVLPGGGFREHTEHDGEGYARWLNRLGLHAVVLRYKLVPDPFPLALQQARSALTALRAGALLEVVDPDHVGLIGASAGGLLAGLLATGAVLPDEDVTESGRRPDFHIQSYGLVDLRLIPDGAVEALLGDKIGWRDALSPVTHVDAETSPTFVWATAQDPPGLPNALEWARVLAEHDVPVELRASVEMRRAAMEVPMRSSGAQHQGFAPAMPQCPFSAGNAVLERVYWEHDDDGTAGATLLR